MSRRGLVSKSFGPPGGSPGGAALVPKGEGGPSGSGYLSVEEVAKTLRVTPAQVSEWVRKDTLRGNDSGVKPYDLKKFQHDSRDEIARAQSQALKEAQKPVEKSHQKSAGFFAKLFGKGKSVETPAGSDAALARENKKLKEELRRAKSETKDEAATSRLEEKVRYLEDKLGRSAELENELASLRRQMADTEAAGPPRASNDAALERQVEELRRELAHAQDAVRQGEAARQELSLIHGERARLESETARLESELSLLKQQTEDPNFGSPELESQLREARNGLEELENRHSALQSHLDQRERTIADLEAELENARNASWEASSSPLEDQTPLIEELLALQEGNLQRFRRLKELKDQAEQKLALGASSEESSGPSDGSFPRLQAEFETLRVKHQSLLEARETNTPGHQEFVEQLAAARVTTTRLRQENTALKTRLSETDVEGWKQKVEELQRRLRDAADTDQSLEQMELELRATRKSLQAREAQVQKIAGRVQENERALKKALKESTRLTELLIERENRLRDLSTEYEQEYRDKLDSLDRQVSSLQWKLSLRDERIASLESEVGELRKQVGR